MVLQDLSHFTEDHSSFIDTANVVLSSIQIDGVDQTEKNRIAKVLRKIILDEDLRDVRPEDIHFILGLVTGKLRENIISKVAHRRCLRDREDCLHQAEHIISQIQARLEQILAMVDVGSPVEDEEEINKGKAQCFELVGGGSIRIAPAKHLNGSGVFQVRVELPENIQNEFRTSREFGCDNYRIFDDEDGSRVLCIYDKGSSEIQHAYYIEAREIRR